MKVNWLHAATLAIAASTGAPFVVRAETVYNISDEVVDAKPEGLSPSDHPAAESLYADNAMAPADKAAPACQACEAAEEEAVCEPWRLFCQKEDGINVYGWADGGIMGNSRGTASNFNGPVTFPDRNDGQFNQLYLIAEKTIDTGGCGCDWGGRLDLLYGSDYIFTQATGLETRGDGTQKWNSNPNMGLAMPQAYVEGGYNNLSVKLGHFYTPIGYEVVPATGNFFYSHAYTMQYGEPFTHTGGIATYKYSETVNLVGGFVNGWDAFDRTHDAGMGIAGMTWTGDYTTIAYNYGYSVDEPTLLGTLSNRHISSLVVTYKIDDEWTYVFQNDIGWQNNASPFDGGNSSAEWYGINQYLFYTINDCWKAGARVEWFRDDDGARVGGIRPGNPTDPAGFAGHFYQITAGLNWTPSANITVRPELRYDIFDGVSASGNEPYNDGNSDTQFLFGLDAIFLF